MQPLKAVVTPPRNSTIDRVRPIRVPRWVRNGIKVAGTVAPGPAAFVAQRLFFSPPRTRVREGEQEVLARGERFSFEAGGRRVVGRAWGEGPTVLLVHGWGGHSGQMTSLVEPIATAGFRAVAIDLPGHGESAGRLCSVVHAAAAIEGVCSALPAGAGLGGALLRRRGEHLFHLARRDRGARCVLRSGGPFRVFLGTPPGRSRRLGWDDRAHEEGDGALAEHPLRGDLAPQLAPGMGAPLLVLHDPGDREMPFAEGEELAGRWPGAELCSAPGRGHLRILHDAECVADAVQFLAA